MKLSFIDEFYSDWVLSGKSAVAGTAYKKNLILIFKYCADPQLVDIKNWLATTSSKEVRRKQCARVRACRSVRLAK